MLKMENARLLDDTNTTINEIVQRNEEEEEKGLKNQLIFIYRLIHIPALIYFYFYSFKDCSVCQHS